jgi:hypothetical protein
MKWINLKGGKQKPDKRTAKGAGRTQAQKSAARKRRKKK